MVLSTPHLSSFNIHFPPISSFQEQLVHKFCIISSTETLCFTWENTLADLEKKINNHMFAHVVWTWEDSFNESVQDLSEP